MRRVLVILAGLGVLQGVVGCQCSHIAGKCDCQPPIHPCSQYGLYAAEPPPPPVIQQASYTEPARDEAAPTRKEKLPAPREDR